MGLGDPAVCRLQPDINHLFFLGYGRPDLMADPRFKTNDDRVAHRAECVATLSEIFRAQPMVAWVDLISQAGVPCGPINRVSDVVNDPQVLAREMIAAVPHPTVPELR